MYTTQVSCLVCGYKSKLCRRKVGQSVKALCLFCMMSVWSLKPVSYFLWMQSEFWRHMGVFPTIFLLELNTVQLLRIIQCEFVMSNFVREPVLCSISSQKWCCYVKMFYNGDNVKLSIDNGHELFPIPWCAKALKTTDIFSKDVSLLFPLLPPLASIIAYFTCIVCIFYLIFS